MYRLQRVDCPAGVASAGQSVHAHSVNALPPIHDELPRAVLDINVLIGALLGPRSASRRILDAWQAGRFQHVTSEHIIRLTLHGLSPASMRRGFPSLATAVPALEARLRADATIVPVAPADVVSVTGDPEDDTVLATARLGKAHDLVTNDRGLLALFEYAGARIVTPNDFLALLDADPAV